MRMALGRTPINRMNNLEKDFCAVEEAALATEKAYQNVVDRLRENDNAAQESLFTASDRSLATVEGHDEHHRSAAAALQPRAKPKNASDISTANILTKRLRSEE